MPVLEKFNKCKNDASGNPIGEDNSNPMLYSRIYELEFLDKRIEEFAINVLAENIFNQDDLDGLETDLIN